MTRLMQWAAALLAILTAMTVMVLADALNEGHEHGRVPSAAPCVAWSYLPEIPHYTPREPAEEYIVRIDWQVYDRLFPGCDIISILVATPDIIIRAFRLDNLP
jgi:hypothetical protein